MLLLTQPGITWGVFLRPTVYRWNNIRRRTPYGFAALPSYRDAGGLVCSGKSPNAKKETLGSLRDVYSLDGECKAEFSILRNGWFDSRVGGKRPWAAEITGQRTRGGVGRVMNGRWSWHILVDVRTTPDTSSILLGVYRKRRCIDTN